MPAEFTHSVDVQVQSVASVKITDERGYGEPIGEEALAEQEVFERVVGVKPSLVIEDLGRKAAEGCKVKDCELRVACEDDSREFGDEGDGAYNQGFSGTARKVSATVTCARAGSRAACQRKIKATGDVIQQFLDEVAGHSSAVQEARQDHMAPAKQAATDTLEEAARAAEAITQPAKLKAADIVKAAKESFGAVEAGMATSLREKWDIDNIATQALAED